MNLTNKESHILSNHREILWLKRQIENNESEERTQLDSEENIIPIEATDEHVEESLEEYKKHIDTLKTNYDMLYQFNKSKELLAQAANKHALTLDALYPSDNDHSLEEKINKRDELVVQFMGLLQQLNKKKSELTQVQRQIMRQHEKNKHLTAEINDIRSSQASEQTEEPGAAELLKELKDLKNQMATIRSVLNGLIVESGIPWAEDERWLNTMLRIGEPI